MLHQYSLDPNIDPSAPVNTPTLTSFTLIREPFVCQLHIKRSLWILLSIAILVVALTCVYVFPLLGKKLLLSFFFWGGGAFFLVFLFY